MICPICATELGPLELQGNKRFHFACRYCVECKAEIPNDEICEKSFEEHGSIMHSGCAERRHWSDFQRKDVPFVQSHVNLINQKICTMRRPLALDNLEQFYSLLRDLQQCAANVKVLIDRTKDRNRVQDAKEYREKTDLQKQAERRKSLLEETKKIQLAEERANPALRDRRKAIAGLVALGMSQDQAEAMVPQPKAN